MNIKIAALLTGLVFAAGAAQADTGFSAGASVGNAKVKVDQQGIVFDGSDLAWKIFGNYMFTENWGVEGAYISLGQPDDTINVSGFPAVNVKIDASGFELLGIGRVAVSDSVDLFGKLGFIRWDADFSANVSGTGIDDSDSGTDAAFGLGGSWKVSDQFKVRGEWELFNIQDTDTVWMISIGGEFLIK